MVNNSHYKNVRIYDHLVRTTLSIVRQLNMLCTNSVNIDLSLIYFIIVIIIIIYIVHRKRYTKHINKTKLDRTKRH